MRPRVRGQSPLAETGLVLGTFGNVSDSIARAASWPSSPVACHTSPDARSDGAGLAGIRRRCGRLPAAFVRHPTHVELYRAFPGIGGIVHTHSEYATVFAQARQPIRCMGTTHADYFHGDVPVTRPMTAAEIETDYEMNTGHVIVETFTTASCRPTISRRVLVANHGPFTWGVTAFKAIEHAKCSSTGAARMARARAEP